ncbi:lipopolysaccharide biosynthesis protein RfbH [Goodfellowiella coeruleoviolacea]|uniref:CDP-6-deoxy-D-xylo-4-hexulose-3-dehydrase n=1 Tax=Goodfellowiella coeruleoviolacea TaxID=334858 RepID=A0AAE3GKA3_9PSEU|nr:lipopolysaccharide biosynthesis protein RfbH [Goodfellowiella coeruleoviolacea]MCP2167713.1 CDP-6-deoxy-D-xylo-4-hexulose-3-dehydrase [Goodfellowiella coeruleoviolacea]
MTDDESAETRQRILELVHDYDKQTAPEGAFQPGRTPIRTSGAVLTAEDRAALVEAALELRIASGATARRFERAFARELGVRKAHLVNSGSSANLLAVTALTSPTLGADALRPGDEVITVAAGFPTTVNPILQNGLVPVFVDVELGTYNTTPERVAAAIGPRTRAIVMAHTLGNPFAAEEIRDVAREHGLYLVEDNCDAVGSRYRGRPTGGFGDLSTASFYPAHHITSGEGGCVTTNNPVLARIVESLRDWGRDCWCEPGQDDACRRRFAFRLGGLPPGYDHKYTFSHVGYNLKTTDLQAALALNQLGRLGEFTLARQENWRRLRAGLDGLPWLLLPSPTPDSEPSWFGFAITVAADAPFGRHELVRFLESRRIATRMLFAGNLVRQPAYTGRNFRVSGSLANTDAVTERSFWIGVYPGITAEMADYVVASLHEWTARFG